MRAACYVRVSRSDQHSELQRDETARLVAARGWSAWRTFADEGISGASTKRPAFLAMMESARRREFDVLVVYKTDRVFRSLAHLVTTVSDLHTLGVGFVSATEPFDAATAEGSAMMAMCGVFAEFERAMLRQRTRDGLAAARRRGVVLGRRTVQVDERRMLELRASGLSIKSIARVLGVSAGTIHTTLAESGDFSRRVVESAPRRGSVVRGAQRALF